MSTRAAIADRIDRALLGALIDDPDATGLMLSARTGLARNTVRSRLARYAEEGSIHGFEHRIDPAFLGYPLRASVHATVLQRDLAEVGEQLAAIPEVLEVLGIAGAADLIIEVVARDADDLYRVAGSILAIEGITRTETGIVMRRLVPYRTAQLLRAP